MKIVKDILENKGHDVWAVGPDDTVYHAIETMAEKGVGALLVMAEGKSLGIVSERDYARKVILRGRASKETLVKEIMTEDLVTGGSAMTIEEAMALMSEKRVRHLPIVDEGELAGMISIGDLVKAKIADQRFQIEQLEKYITGRVPFSV